MANKKVQDILYSEEANKVFQYTSIEELLEDPDKLVEMISEHEESQVPRLKILNDYFLGNNWSILNRDDRKNNKADHRATHNFARYISQFIQGYMTGVPIKVDTNEYSDYVNDEVETDGEVTVDEEETSVPTPLLNDIIELNNKNEVDSLNSELSLDLSKYGRAYELVYRDTEDNDKLVLLDVMKTFTIHDIGFSGKPIGAVYYDDDPREEGDLIVILYSETMRYDIRVTGGKVVVEEGQPHFYDEVPIIEYSNNRFRQGDYEIVIPLIDLYDSAQSDTANYMTDFNDAILAFSGNLDGGLDTQQVQDLLDMGLLFLGDGVNADGSRSPLSAEYLIKQYDVNGAEAYKKRLEEDIHKFSNTPNLNDTSFGGQQTGVAMKYKLFGLEQSRAIKEQLFKKGLAKRYRLVNSLRRYLSEPNYDYINEVSFTFKANLPESEEGELQAFYQAGGKLSNETLLSTLSFVDDPKEEQKRIEAEQTLYGSSSTDLDLYSITNSRMFPGVEEGDI